MPAFVLRLCYVSKMANKIGTVLLCYIIGLIFGQLFIGDVNSNIPDILSTILVPLSLPMLLFETDLKKWKRVAGKSFISMIIAIVGLVISISVGYLIFKDRLPEADKVGGLLAGLYTGGTPNLASIKIALGIDEATYIAVNTADICIGALYVLFLISFAKKVFSKILPPYKGATSDTQAYTEGLPEENRVIKRLKSWIRYVSFPNILAAFGVSLLIAAISAAVGFLLIKNEAFQMAALILMITTLSIIAATLKPIKKIKGSFDTGMYLILIFSIVVASMADLSSFSDAVLPLLGYVAIATFGTLILHILGCKIFKVDVDTAIVTSAALICSPPFVPVVCGAIKNRDVMVSGLTIGIIGYAVGNYLGVLIAYIL
ncbi:MAG: DUF819 family protein [Bacteroidales bacterium]|nr:DUF819 family protein [Bacteroidales bacterium]